MALNRGGSWCSSARVNSETENTAADIITADIGYMHNRQCEHDRLTVSQEHNDHPQNFQSFYRTLKYMFRMLVQLLDTHNETRHQLPTDGMTGRMSSDFTKIK